jgi:hypothetical protein
MKPKKKSFDCVEMKNRIQAKLQREEAKYGKEEAARRRRARVLADPILSRFFRDQPATSVPALRATKRVAGRRS